MAYEAYTDETFKAYLHGLMARSGYTDVLGWSVELEDYDEMCRDTLYCRNLSDASAATSQDDISALRKVGAVMLWRAIVQALSTQFDVSVGGGNSFKRSQMLEGAKTSLGMAEAAAIAEGLSIPLSGLGPGSAPEAYLHETGNDSPYRRGNFWFEPRE